MHHFVVFVYIFQRGGLTTVFPKWFKLPHACTLGNNIEKPDPQPRCYEFEGFKLCPV